jgi:hypothetical protein
MTIKIAIENKITALFMGRTDKLTGLWFPVQKMTWSKNNGEYSNCITVFTNGAKQLEQLHPEQPSFVTFGSLNRVVKSKDISNCPWSNRMPVNQEPNSNVIEFLGLDSDLDLDPVMYVARDGGYRHGDMRNIFPQIEPDRFGQYNFIFRNIDSYCFSSENKSELNHIKQNERVTPQFIDGRLQLICHDSLIGYAPPHIRELFKKYQNNLKIEVYQVNQQAPFAYQFLLLATLHREIGIPFSEPEYQAVN